MSNEPTYKGPTYPTQAHGSIPAFNSYEEEATFSDTHSTPNFPNKKEAEKVSPTRRLSETVKVHFDQNTHHEIEPRARERGKKKPPQIRMGIQKQPPQDQTRPAS